MKRSRAALLAWVLAGAALLAVLFAVVGMAWGRHALNGRLDALRARGAPLTVDGIAWREPGPGADPLPWLKEVEALQDGETEEVERARDQRWHAALEGLVGARERVDAAAGDRECFYGRLDADLADPRRGPELAATYRDVLALRASEEHELVELARGIDACARIDMRSLFEPSWSSGSAPTELPVAGGFAVGRGLVCAIGDDAARGEVPAALADLRRLFRLAEIFSGSPLILGEAMSTGLRATALDETRVCMNLLPPGTVGAEIEPLLAALEPTDTWRFALLGERAWIHGLFEDLRQGRGVACELEGLSGWRRGLLRRLLDLDEPFALDRLEATLECLDAPWETARPRLAALESDRPAPWQVVSAMTTVQSTMVTNVRALEARIALLRCALQARDRGDDAGIELARQTSDPFGAASLQARLDPDGILVLWSVGPDGEDDGGVVEEGSEEGDLVVAVRPGP